jgi:transposase InsO family protein
MKRSPADSNAGSCMPQRRPSRGPRSPFAARAHRACCGRWRSEQPDRQAHADHGPHWMIRMSEAHLRSILREWAAHYNGRRAHSSLGPGVPGPTAGSARAPKPNRDVYGRRVQGALVRAKSVLGGLHHEYSL